MRETALFARRLRHYQRLLIHAQCLAVGLMVPAVAVAAADQTWTLHTADTEISITVIDDHPVVERLAAVGSAWNWIDAPAPVPLMERVWVGGQERRLAWTFENGAFDPAAGELTLTFRTAEPALVLRSIWRARSGRGPVEHRLELDNRSGTCVTVSHQDSLTLANLRAAGPATVWWIRRGGGNASTQGGTFSEPLVAGLDLLLASNCEDGASPVPWLAVQQAEAEGLYTGWEFSGLGHVHAVAPEHDGGRFQLDVGLHPDFKTDVDAGETWLVPAALVGCYRGDLDEGSYSLHRFVIEHLRPPVPAGCPDPVLAYNLYLDVGGNQATEADVLRSAAVCHDLGFECFMPDAMWFPETGDWRWDPRRFPRGIGPIESFVHGAGMKLALWCAWTNGGVSEHPDALSVRGAVGQPTWFRADYPDDWQPGPFYGAQLCLGCAAAQEWATRKTRWLVEHHQLDYLKHDCGPIVTQCDQANHRHRYGVDASYWATRGYYAVQRQLREAAPHVILENCSGGGHIKDFGVLAYTHYTVATDTLSNLPNRQAMYDSTLALPPLVLQCYTYDNYYPVPGDAPGPYLWRTAMMGAWQIDPTDTAIWTEDEKAATRRCVELYREWIRPMLADVKVHHVLPRPDGVHWDGLFYWSPALRRGTLYVWRPDSPDPQQTVRLKGLDESTRYWVWSEEGAVRPGLRSGAELMHTGLDLRLSQAYTSDLVFVQPEDSGKPEGLEAPGEFQLLAADPQSGVYSASVHLAWEPSQAARSYQVSVAQDAALQEIVARRAVTKPDAVFEDLPCGHTLYWCVEAVAWGGRRTSSGAPGRFITPPENRPAGLVFASDLPWTTAHAGADNPVRRDVNYYGHPIAIAGRRYPKGLWTHAYPDATSADTVYDVAEMGFEFFRADVGLDDASGAGSVQFQVLVDGVVRAETPVLHPKQVRTLCVDISQARQVTLRVLNGGDGYSCDHAAWGAARFVKPGVKDPLDQPD